MKFINKATYKIIYSYLLISIMFILQACDFGNPGSENIDKFSAIRFKNETYKEAKKRNLRSVSSRSSFDSALDVAVPLDEIDFTVLPDWEDYENVHSAFKRGRDERFIDWYIFKRRATWLYPDDGCFIRADLLKDNLELWSYPGTMKFFVYGDLKIDTENHPDGSVRWWYHVVNIIAQDGEPLVFDPSIDPNKPLSLNEWINSMSKAVDPETFTFSLCSSGTVIPYNSCFDPEQEHDSMLEESFLQELLRQEWIRIKNLGRNPREELGDSPPWM